MDLFLGIDFGTTGVRTSVINQNKEEIINHSVSITSPILKDSKCVKILDYGGRHLFKI